MKKATIKRRKRVIPATQDDEMEDVDSLTEALRAEGTPERGTENDDGSINLGIRRRPDQYLSVESQAPAVRSAGQLSPLPLASSDLAAYHHRSGQSPNSSTYPNEDNRLPPMSSMATISDRQSSVSPASFLSSRRKRSFSATDTETGSNLDLGHDSAKRISSIKSILNPSSAESPKRPGSAGIDDYTLPPLRSTGGFVGSRVKSVSPGVAPPRDGQDRSDRETGHRQKAERRLALQREADSMREQLAAKERELLELGNNY